jgi:hypothetical protein
MKTTFLISLLGVGHPANADPQLSSEFSRLVRSRRFLYYLRDGSSHPNKRFSVERFELNPNRKSAQTASLTSNLGLTSLVLIVLPFWSLACSLGVRNNMLARHTQI